MGPVLHLWLQGGAFMGPMGSTCRRQWFPRTSPRFPSGPLASLFLASKAPVPIFSGAFSLQRAETFSPNVRASAFSSVHPLPTPGKEKSSRVCVCGGAHTQLSIHPNTLSCHPDAEAIGTEALTWLGSPYRPSESRNSTAEPCASQP